MLLFGISNFPIRIHKDAHGLPRPLPVASAAAAGRPCVRRQGLQALLVGIYFWSRAPATYIFSVPLAYNHAAFWLLKQCQLSCIPRFCVNIFTFVTPNWLNATQAF